MCLSQAACLFLILLCNSTASYLLYYIIYFCIDLMYLNCCILKYTENFPGQGEGLIHYSFSPVFSLSYSTVSLKNKSQIQLLINSWGNVWLSYTNCGQWDCINAETCTGSAACCHTKLLYTWNSPLQEENFIFSKSNKAHTIGSAIEHPIEWREAHSEQRGAVSTFQV